MTAGIMLWNIQDSNLQPPACKAGALPLRQCPMWHRQGLEPYSWAERVTHVTMRLPYVSTGQPCHPVCHSALCQIVTCPRLKICCRALADCYEAEESRIEQEFSDLESEGLPLPHSPVSNKCEMQTSCCFPFSVATSVD